MTSQDSRQTCVAVGDVIRWSSGGSKHIGTVVEVLSDRHVRVDNWPIVIPPNWILGEVTDEGDDA